MSKYKEPRARWQFANEEELVDYIANLFDIEPLTPGSIRGTSAQVRNRRRIQASESRPLLFDNPVLDYITSPRGEIVIGSQSFNLRARRLGETSHRLVTLDPPANSFTAVHALSCTTDFTGLDVCVSDDGRQRTYSDGMASLSFKSFKNSSWFWTMGTEIKTYGGNFEAAVINSRYYGQAYAQTCSVEYDDDSATNSKKLEEYDWGVFAPQPKKVESLCRVQWNGRRISGVVSAGDDCFVVGSVFPWPEGYPEDWPPLVPPDPPGTLSIRPTSLSFTSRPSSPSITKSITITSSFPGPVSVTVEDAIVTTPPADPPPTGTISFGGEPKGEFSNLSGQLNIQPNTSIQIPVTFTGESGLGSITGSLRILWNQGQFRVGLLGTLVQESAFSPI